MLRSLAGMAEGKKRKVQLFFSQWVSMLRVLGARNFFDPSKNEKRGYNIYRGSLVFVCNERDFLQIALPMDRKALNPRRTKNSLPAMNNSHSQTNVLER